jgi:hypothetical protein
MDAIAGTYPVRLRPICPVARWRFMRGRLQRTRMDRRPVLVLNVGRVETRSACGMGDLPRIEEVLLRNDSARVVHGEAVDYAQRAGGVPDMAQKLDCGRGQGAIDVGVDDFDPGDERGQRCPPFLPEVGFPDEWDAGATGTQRRPKRDGFGVRDGVEVALAEPIQDIGSGERVKLIGVHGWR